jgi:thermitase
MSRMVLALLFVLTSIAAPGRASVPAEPISLIVRVSRDATPTEEAALHGIARATVTGRIDRLRLVRVSVPAVGAAIYRSSSLVRWTEPERIFHVHALNDPLLHRQWALDTLGVKRIWRKETGTTYPVTVAVVDTGVDLSHPDLIGRLLPGYDYVNNDESPQDDHGHGTHVAGVIAANPDNRTGIAGMSWGAKVMPLKACDEEGACSDFAVLASIVHAVTEGVRVVNLSLGGPSPACPRPLELAAQFAETRGSLLVAAAGNSAAQGNPISYPAACDGFVTVGATDPLDRWAGFSGYGEHVDVSAPGVQILSTLPPDRSDKATPGYGLLDGTSMAAPHVSGLAALLFSSRPESSPAEVLQRMKETAVDLGKKGWDRFYGHGRIDVRRAVAKR